MTVPRIVIAVYEVPGWGGAATTRYDLFARMQRDGIEVAFVNLVHPADALFFRHVFGETFGNPAQLANVHTHVLELPLWRIHESLAATIDAFQADLLVGVGFIATRLLRLACSTLPLVMLTTGSRRLKRLISDGTVRDFVTFQRNVLRGVRYRPPLDDLEAGAEEAADLIVPHAPPARIALTYFARQQARKLYARDLSMADVVYEEAVRSGPGRPFHERDIDVLFACSSWDDAEKNLPLVSRLVAALPNRTIHVTGELNQQLPARCHGLVDRGALLDLMRRARVFVSPSLFDAAPNVLFEASALGCNVVASPNCGTVDLCHQALRVERPDVAGFVGAIERGLQAPCADNRARFFGGYRELVDTLLAMTAIAPRAQRASPSVAPAARALRAPSLGTESLPAFIIAGAKKCGTTTLHHLLAARPDVFLPRREVGFFYTDADLPLSAYTHLFEGVPRGTLCGERSTMYFTSSRGAQRIAATIPDVKLIFLLRDPVGRTWSHYWHRVLRLREGRAFEDVIRDTQNLILVESDYRRALERYFDLFDRARIKVVLFEEFIAEPETTLNEVAAFLGLQPYWREDVRRHRNQTEYPRWPRVVLGYNRLRRRTRIGLTSRTLFPTGNRRPPAGMVGTAVQAVDATVTRLAFSPEIGRPALREDTHARLAEYLSRVNHGLSALLGRDLGTVWLSFHE
jgi:glycosyltransferase involved in cell wall biosynthesis